MKNLGGQKMRLKESMLYVENRLEEWAEWFSGGNWYGLGFSNCSIVHRLMTEGVIVKAERAVNISSNKSAEEMENLIQEMWKQNEDLANALRINYLTKGSIRFKAIKFSCDRRELASFLNMARYWLAGRLTAAQERGKV